MKRHLGIVTAATLMLWFGPSEVAGAIIGARTSTGSWGCVVVRTADQAVCLENPLPEELPLPR